MSSPEPVSVVEVSGPCREALCPSCGLMQPERDRYRHEADDDGIFWCPKCHHGAQDRDWLRSGSDEIRRLLYDA